MWPIFINLILVVTGVLAVVGVILYLIGKGNPALGLDEAELDPTDRELLRRALKKEEKQSKMVD